MSATSERFSLMGLETEYALTIFEGKKGKRSPLEEGAYQLLRKAVERYPSLPSADGQGVFLGNGGKLYVDLAHPEYATPECESPLDLVRYTLAGDRIMGQLVRDLERASPTKAIAFRGNVGYGDKPETWGCHESYLSHRPPADYVDQMPSFLATRFIFCGSGGFDPFHPGIAFTLSPRSHFISTVAHSSTMDCRPLINMKDEPLAGSGFHRLHLICGDGLASETSLWLRAGTTAAVIAMLDAGVKPMQGLTLKNPISAMKTFAANPLLDAAVPTFEGQKVTAIDIQRRFLDAATEHFTVQDPSDYPHWINTVLEGWRQVLDLLEHDPVSLDTVLDWRIKQVIYREFCEDNGIPWDSLPRWNKLINGLLQAKARSLKVLIDELGPDCDISKLEPPVLLEVLNDSGLDLKDLPKVASLRSQLFELELRFLQIGGIFNSLDKSGALSHRVVSNGADIDKAVKTPPGKGRAFLRGRFVQKFTGQGGHSAGWTSLIDSRLRKIASLDDPFIHTAHWKLIPKDMPRELSELDLRGSALTAFLMGRYDEAYRMLTHLLIAGYEVPSTLCHLARVALAQDRLTQAVEHTHDAWEERTGAASYVVPRIIWLQIALRMVQQPEEPLADLVSTFKEAMRHTFSYDWSIHPVLDHLRGKITDDHHRFLTALSVAINNHNQIPALDAFECWRNAG